jgi:predicted HTH transcriptional regulator
VEGATLGTLATSHADLKLDSVTAMTTDEILAGIDRSLAAIAAERERLLAARAQLGGTAAHTAPTASVPPQRRTSRRTKQRRGDTLKSVLEALDATEPRTAGEIEKISSVPRALAGTTLSRLVKQGLASKAVRGYRRVAA